MKWLLSLLWNPIAALDMGGSDGRPSHKKIMGFFAFMVFIGLILIDKLPPLGHTIALISASFGLTAWLYFLASKAATSRERLEQRDVEERYPYGAPTHIFHGDEHHESADLPPRSPDASG